MSVSNPTPLLEGRRSFPWIASAFVLLAITAISLPSRLVLVVRNETKEAILLRMNVGAGFEFATKIRHSVQLTPVYEYYRVEADGRLTVTGTKLQDLGWGMPSTEDTHVVFKDGFMYFEGGRRKLEVLRFRVSRMNDAELLIDGRHIELNSCTGDGDLLVFAVLRESFIPSLLKGEYDAF